MDIQSWKGSKFRRKHLGRGNYFPGLFVGSVGLAALKYPKASYVSTQALFSL